MNDNTPTPIADMTDKECLDIFVELFKTRVGIDSAFVIDDDTGYMTHQVLTVVCGEHRVSSAPEPLPFPLTLATAEDMGESVN
jgi:hypothetical protein